MEFVECLQETTMANTKAKTPAPIAQNQNGMALLSIIQIALAADFARFENVSNAKILIHKLKDQVDLQNHTVTRSASLPSHRKLKISSSHPPKRPTKKGQTSKSLPSAKTAPAKTGSGQGAPPLPAPAAPKPAVNEAPAKSKSSKLKKKIHKNQELRKDHTRRAPDQCLITTAQIPRIRLGDREKRRIRKLLMQRQIKDWNRTEQLKREGRELRYQH